ncbi:MAG TPA: hypothetical protein DEV72_08050 [Ktedonobacter sp.]|nr:hypothetical protein [Ktedonobacter sp.]
MKLRLIVSIVMFFLLVVVVVGAVLFGPALLSVASNRSGSSDTSQPTALTSNPIARENAQPGTISWQIPTVRAATTEIQAYANATNVQPGKTLTFYVSSQKEGTTYWIDIYRLGWYGGDGGRLITSVGKQVGHVQGYYDAVNHQLVGCSTCIIHKSTGLIEANWKPSYTLTILPEWTTGIYLAKFTEANGLQTYVPFDVLGNPNSRYVVVTPDTTYAAYNDWGGLSLYSPTNSPFAETDSASTAKAVKVSFDRPYTQDNGVSQVLAFEANAVHWMERQGYDLSYISNVDLHDDPAQLRHHHAYISLGHDEYWTKQMRDGVERARNDGVGLAFLGANASFWQMRFEADSAGTPDRTVVCYKVSTLQNDLARDPFYGKDNTLVTAHWRDPVLARPENALVGIMYSNYTDQQSLFPWRVDVTAKSRILDSTGLQPGQSYGCDLVGYEWDRVFQNGATPPGLQVIAQSPTKNYLQAADFSNTTYYIAPSGAMVFASGSILLTAALDSYRLHRDNTCYLQNSVVPAIQKLMANVMEALPFKHPA